MTAISDCPRFNEATPRETAASRDAGSLPVRRAHLAALMTAVMLAACGGGSDSETLSPSPSPSPAPSPSPSPSPSACGTMTALTTADLSAYAGTYAVKHFDSGSGSEVGSGNLTLSGTTLTVTPGSGVSGSSTSAEVTAVCANTNGSGARIGVVAMMSGDRHMDFFSPAFNGLYASGSDLSDSSSRYVQATTAAGEPAPAPAPAGWGTATVRSTALAADRVVAPNLLPDLDWETTSFGAGRKLSMRRSANPLQGNAGLDSVSVRYVAATGQLLSVAVALVPDPSQPLGTANYAATCGPCTGVTVDTTAGTVTFTDTPLTPTILSGSQQPATLSGSYQIPDWRPRTGTTVTAAGLAGCSINANALSATFSDIGCLDGTYVGTGIDGQACTVKIDSSAQTFRFDDGVKNNTFSFSSASGYTNLGTFKSAFVQSATLSRAIGSLESISLSAAPSAAVPEVTVVDLNNVQHEGGTLNSVYSRACRIEFDRRTP